MLNKDLKEEVEIIMRRAGDILLSFFNKPLKKTQKPHEGIVTQADIASETLLKKELAALIPGASFFAEESGLSEGNDYCWVIDPLDGTTNFAHGVPYFCISVALNYKGRIIGAFVYHPITREFFYAQEGKGAFLNDSPINIGSQTSLRDCLIVVGVPYEKDDIYRAVLKDLTNIAPEVDTIRCYGAIALDQAYLASGRIQGIFFRNLRWWDVAAGVLLITEAGGRVTDYEGNSIDQNYASFIAGNPVIHGLLFKLMKRK